MSDHVLPVAKVIFCVDIIELLSFVQRAGHCLFIETAIGKCIGAGGYILYSVSKSLLLTF